METKIQRMRTELLPVGQTKRFFTLAIIPEVKVSIASKMAHSTYALDPYELVRKGQKGGGEPWYITNSKMNYCRLAKRRDSPRGQ